MIAARNIDWSLVRQMADASLCAYAQQTALDPRTDTQVNVTLAGDKIIVAFRGSSSAADFLLDEKFWMTRYQYDFAQAAYAEVHAGFYSAFRAVRDQVFNQVRALLSPSSVLRTPSPPVGEKDGLRGLPPALYLTGHSLGGALAILCALEMTRQNFPVAGVYTFGQPRVGNKVFATIYNSTSPLRLDRGEGQGEVSNPLPPIQKLKDITLCLVNVADPVPLLPPLLNGYRDCGTEVFLKSDGTVLIDPWIGAELLPDMLGVFRNWRRGMLALLPNHYLASYNKRLLEVKA